jgi:leader peptidase (prepilin peptidase)/N-methyltransferase
MVVIFFIDLDHQIIPDKITLPGIPLCFILAGTFLPDPFFRDKPLGLPGAYIGMASGCFFFFTIALYGSYILKKEAIGFGDIKFMTMIGSVLGWKGVFLTTFTASLLGVLIGVPLVVVQKKSETARKIPFGPFLAIGASICLFFGQEILQFYVQMIY